MRSSFLITLIAITRLVCGGPVAPDNDAAFAEAIDENAAFGGAIDEELASILNNSTLQMSGAISEKADGIAINPNSSEPIALSKLSGPSQILQMHNSRRYYHQVAPLRWSQGLANFAQSWANQCHYGHTNDPRFGENIAMGLPTWEATMKAWSDDEEGLFDYQNGGFSQATGHFTQIAWRETTLVGCAVQQCTRGLYFVCEYSAPGNVRGGYRQNVFPRRGY